MKKKIARITFVLLFLFINPITIKAADIYNL